MCGSYDSVIGMEASLALHRFVRKIPGEKLRPADGPVTLCGIIADIDSSTGLCRRIEPFRMGGVLRPAAPATA
jgi:calcineurin-like phosphoesterase